jgi:hypothetical protein
MSAKALEYDLVSFNHWFTSDVVYEGVGRAEFADAESFAEGRTIVRFDEKGEASIQMQVERFGPRDQGATALVFGWTSPNPCVSLRVQTSEGVFHAPPPIRYAASIAGDIITSIGFSIHKGEFWRDDHRPVHYFAIPLINFTFKFVEARPEILSHPLRMRRPAPFPDELPPERVDLFRLLAWQEAQLIGFNFEGRTAFVEPVPAYAELEKSLSSHDRKWAITALMVGSAKGRSVAFDAVLDWIPFYLFPVLELLCGREFGAAWIEWHDETGGLVGRTHVHTRCPAFSRGFAAFRVGSLDGAGLLLTEAQNSTYLREPFLQGTVRNLVRSADDDILESRAAFVFLALEALCGRFGVGSQDLSASLDPETRSAVRELLANVARDLRNLATESLDSDQRRAIRTIADRAAGMDQKDRNFGAAVASLMKLFKFEDDLRLAGENYALQRVDTRTWEAAVSHWRGLVLHGGTYDLASGNYDFDLILSTCYHLHDLAFRIVLKLLGYSGQYQPAVSLMLNPCDIDWVNASTGTDELGYARGYRTPGG